MICFALTMAVVLASLMLIVVLGLKAEGFAEGKSLEIFAQEQGGDRVFGELMRVQRDTLGAK